MRHSSATPAIQCFTRRGVYFCKQETQPNKTAYLGVDGLAIYYKRLEKGAYELPAITSESTSATIDSVQLQLILQGIVLNSVRKKLRFSLPK